MNVRDDAPLAGFEDFDAMDPSLRGRYQEILDARMGPTWPLGRRARHLLVGAVGAAGFLIAGSLSLTEPSSTPTPTRAVLGLLALLGLGWSMFAIRGLARHAGDFASERLLASRIAVGFALVALAGLGLASAAMQKEAATQLMLTVALGFVVVAAAGSIQAKMDMAELSIREQLLRLEARLASSQDRPPAG